MDESAEVADGHAVVASEENENATILLAQDDVRDPMHGGGGCSNVLVAQEHDGVVIKLMQIPSTW